MKDISYRRFLVVWAGQLASGIGTGMTAFALGVYVFNQTGSTACFAAVMLSLFVPGIILSPFGGVLADRFDRRCMIIAGDAGSAAAVAFLLITMMTGELSLWKIYTGVALGSSFTALQGPAYKASLTDMLTKAQFAKAGGLIQLASSARHLIAPIAAGAVLAAAGLEVVLFIDMASFALAVTAVLFMPSNRKKSQSRDESSFLKDITEGFNKLAENREVIEIIIKLTLVTFFAGCVQTVFTPMLLALTDVKTLGIVQSISALGMLAGSLLIGLRGLKRNLRMQFRLGLTAGGLFLAAMGVSTILPVITVLFFLFFLCLPFINTSAEVIIRTAIPNEKQGRIWGLISFLSQIGYLAAYLSAGFIADGIFTPLLLENGAFSGSIGRIIGTGPGRGDALVLFLCGAGLFFTAIIKNKKEKQVFESDYGIQKMAVVHGEEIRREKSRARGLGVNMKQSISSRSRGLRVISSLIAFLGQR